MSLVWCIYLSEIYSSHVRCSNWMHLARKVLLNVCKNAIHPNTHSISSFFSSALQNPYLVRNNSIAYSGIVAQHSTLDTKWLQESQFVASDRSRKMNRLYTKQITTKASLKFIRAQFMRRTLFDGRCLWHSFEVWVQRSWAVRVSVHLLSIQQ